MKAMTRIFPFLMVVFLLGGCATTGPKFSEFAPSMSNLESDAGRIYLYRTAILGAAVQPEVKLNGEVIGRAVPKGFFYVDREPGNYEIMTSTEVKRKLDFTLDKGQTRFVRLNISIGFFLGHVYPELVETEVGEKEIQNCRYIGEKK
jgi:hypothetical protein